MHKQIFKGEELTRTKVRNNILKLWDLTEPKERFDWYDDALHFATMNAPENNFKSVARVCGVIAALSPLKTWEQNKKITITLLQTGDCGQMKQFVSKANRIIESDGSDDAILSILNGRKISAFYLNIRYPHKANNVTIDRHALSIALGKRTTDADYAGMTAKQYEFFVQCYILAGMKVNVSPLLMQSATWVRFRKIKHLY
jgi:hypothetical protein